MRITCFRRRVIVMISVSIMMIIIIIITILVIVMIVITVHYHHQRHHHYHDCQYWFRVCHPYQYLFNRSAHSAGPGLAD